jgi:hypothetical protein
MLRPPGIAVKALEQPGTTMAKTFLATKTRSNRPGWSITFRHPLRYDTQGRLGLKVRRGLSTDIEHEADTLVAQMNTLLRDPAWWNATRRKDAERQFAPPIVRAFFDDLQVGTVDPDALRERHLAMPTRDEGYARVLFVGTTGAGKTTLLRQLIGSDPDADRFPSTAPAKTTIADIEVIAGGDDFRAIVTFFTEFQVQAYVEECITEAALAAHGLQAEARVAERFLNHRDQKFRLSYILGSWGVGTQTDTAQDDIDDEDDSAALIPEDEAVSDADRRANREALAGIVGRIQDLAKHVSNEISETLGVVNAPLSKEDQDAYLELLGEEFEKEIHGQGEFHILVQDVLDLIRTRFDLLESGEISRAPSGWPQSWTFETEDRTEFISSIRWFSSNHWPQFGRLLTPIVNGIRLRGPLYPDLSTRAKLVLIDGQGLGHTPDDASSLTTHISSKFADVDVVLLVDNAQQPMQAAPLSVLRALAISGHEEKLAIAFTHFDQIKGQNLPTMPDRRAHVMASVMSALASLQDTVGVRIVRGLERGIDDRCFMLSGTQKSHKELGPKASAYMTNQLNGLVAFFEKAAEPVVAPEGAALVYDPIGISFAIQTGASKFNRLWSARLGLSSFASARKEHWTRVKALNKRIAGGLGNEYDTLRPVADLQTSLLEAISRYLDAPVSEPKEDAEQQATTRARRIVAARLNSIVRRRLLEDPLEVWRSAYNERGAGSATRRAVRIAEICAAAAPTPGAVMSVEAKVFLKEVTASVVSAITAVGGRLDTPSGNPAE